MGNPDIRTGGLHDEDDMEEAAGQPRKRKRSLYCFACKAKSY
jgi:hypothetical protein